MLGLDWVLLFLQRQLHPTTVVLGLQLLTVLLSCPTLMQRFREASHNGGWLTETDLVLQNRTTVLLGTPLSGGSVTRPFNGICLRNMHHSIGGTDLSKKKKKSEETWNYVIV